MHFINGFVQLFKVEHRFGYVILTLFRSMELSIFSYMYNKVRMVHGPYEPQHVISNKVAF